VISTLTGWRRVFAAFLAVAFLLVLDFSAEGLCEQEGAAQADSRSSIVGTWQVTVAGARYAPHLFQFSQDGAMLSTNPQRVQENPDGSGVNDSIGMGQWRRVGRHFEGRFVELNAHQGTSTPAGTLTVTWSITIKADHLAGTAVARVEGDPETHPATFDGTRITA
jgi:hypothetical protein